MSSVAIRGAAKVAKIYNLTRLEIEGIDFSEFDLQNKEDVQELFERVSELVESGEADVFEPPLQIRGVDPDECTIQIEQKTLYPDEITLRNAKITEILEDLQNAEPGDVYYILSMDGDGEWIIESDLDHIDPKELSLDYLDCSLYFDQYDILREGYLDLICDTILPERISYKEARFELSEFNFEPMHIFGQLYEVQEVDGLKVLQKVDFGGRMLSGTDYIVDDFEEN